MAEGEQVARALAKRIAGITDPAMRVRALGHTLAGMAPGTVADLLTVAVHGAEARDGSMGSLLLAACLALADEQLALLREAVVRAAVEQGQHDTAAILQPRPAAPRAEDESAAVPDFGVGRPVSLGERKSLARRRDRDLLARVLRDPSPDVIRIVLSNPALTEEDVLRLCAGRPVPGDVLREVFRCPRWVVRYRVRRAIVRNPFAPLDLALQLAVLLNAQDAREVAASPELAPSLREACRRVAGLATLH